MPRFHADNHIGMQVRYLVGARAAVGRWVSMRHYVMAFETVFLSDFQGSKATKANGYRV